MSIRACAAAIVMCALSGATAANATDTAAAAHVARIIDGDTVDLNVSQYIPAFDITLSQVQRYRLAGVDAPELRGRTKAAGIAAREFLAAWLAQCKAPLKLVQSGSGGSGGSEKYGRRLADIECAGKLASQVMLDAGHAKPYAGGAR